MRPEEKDRQMRRLFQDMRERDAAGSPAFDRVLRSALVSERVRPAGNAWIRVLPVAALALAAIVVAARLLSNQPHRQPVALEAVPVQVAALSLDQWESPTDSLLRIPDEEWLSGGLQLDPSASDELLESDTTQRDS
jgi:hypothetical protein